MHHFGQALQQVAPYLDRYGYVAVFLAVFLEGVGIPAPGVTLVAAASVAAGRGVMNLPLVAATAIAGALLGFNCGYWLGFAAGERLLQRLPFFNRSRFFRLHRLFERWGAAVVVVAPFVDGLRQINGYAAGIAEMPWRRFAVSNFCGSLVWIGAWSGLAYETSVHAGILYGALRVGSWWWYGGGFLVLAALLAYLFWHRRRRRSRVA